jgi:YD repeat-containing protein
VTLAIALTALIVMTGTAVAQSRTFYDSGGRVVGRSSIDGQGTVTNRDASGNLISRETTSSGGTTTNYDRAGRVIGRETKGRKQ